MKTIWFLDTQGRTLWHSLMPDVPRVEELIATTDRIWTVVRVVGHRVIVE